MGVIVTIFAGIAILGLICFMRGIKYAQQVDSKKPFLWEEMFVEE